VRCVESSAPRRLTLRRRVRMPMCRLRRLNGMPKACARRPRPPPFKISSRRRSALLRNLRHDHAPPSCMPDLCARLSNQNLQSRTARSLRAVGPIDLAAPRAFGALGAPFGRLLADTAIAANPPAFLLLSPSIRQFDSRRLVRRPCAFADAIANSSIDVESTVNQHQLKPLVLPPKERKKKT